MPEGLTLYKYYPPERLDVLQRRMIYFAHPTVFNDPFELQPYIRPSISERLHEVIGRPSYPEGQPYPESYQRLINRSKLERARLEDENRHTLIFSMSQEEASVLMWAYYAKGHTGFAVGFDSSHPAFYKRLDGVPRRLQRVNYATTRPTVDTIDELREQEMLLTKSMHWVHEREWRMFESPFNSDENTPVVPHVWGFRLEPETVRCVIMGARIDPANERHLRAILDAPAFRGVAVLRCALHAEEFALRIDRLPDRAGE